MRWGGGGSSGLREKRAIERLARRERTVCGNRMNYNACLLERVHQQDKGVSLSCVRGRTGEERIRDLPAGRRGEDRRRTARLPRG